MALMGLGPMWQGFIDVSANEICGIDAYGDGTFDGAGLTALADALERNRSLRWGKPNVDVHARPLRWGQPSMSMSMCLFEVS